MITISTEHGEKRNKHQRSVNIKDADFNSVVGNDSRTLTEDETRNLFFLMNSERRQPRKKVGILHIEKHMNKRNEIKTQLKMQKNPNASPNS